MDAVEEINGTYFYHGHTHVVPGERFDQSFIEQLADALGMTAEAVSMILIGQPLVPISGKLSAATLIITVQLVAKRTPEKYNLIARSKDRIQWTSF
ncbi:hypothetical protein [Kluyvera sp. 142486]|uniref:hypothetical protein n=1 Tax=Kluyvera sp. 142486 TaxID=3390050 RepID=UPI0039805736